MYFELPHIHFKLYCLCSIDAYKSFIKRKALTFVRAVLNGAVYINLDTVVIKHDFFYK